MARFIEDRSALKKKKKDEEKKTQPSSSVSKTQAKDIAQNVVNKTADTAKKVTNATAKSVQTQRQNQSNAGSSSSSQKQSYVNNANNRQTASAKASTRTSGGQYGRAGTNARESASKPFQENVKYAGRERAARAKAQREAKEKETEQLRNQVSGSRNPRMLDTDRNTHFETRAERDKRLEEQRRQKSGYNNMASEEAQKVGNRIVGNMPKRVGLTEGKIAASTAGSLLDISDMLSGAEGPGNGKSRDDLVSTAQQRKAQREGVASARDDLFAKRDEFEAKKQRLTKGAKGFEKAYYGAEESLQGMLNDFVLGAAIGGAWEVPLALRVYGESRGKAQQLGATETEDRLNAAKDALIEVATEHLGGAFGAVGKLTGGKKAFTPLTELLERQLAKQLEGKAIRNTAAGAFRWGSDVLGENVEEWIGNPLQNAGENLIYKNRLQAQREADTDASLTGIGNDIRSRYMSDPASRDAFIAHLNSKTYRDEMLAEYKSAGMNDSQANEVTNRMLDFMTAAATGDTKRMKDIRESLDPILTGDIRNKVWDWDENLESLASTSLMTGVTGLPGAVTTTARGQAILDSANSHEKIMNALRKTIAFDKDNSGSAQAMLDDMEKGYNPSATQAYSIMVNESKVLNDGTKAQFASEQVKDKRVKQENLLAPPAVWTPEGRYEIVGEKTAERYMDSLNDTLEYIDIFNRGRREDGQFKEEDARRVATAAAKFNVGTFTVQEAYDLSQGDKADRHVFEQMTGTKLNQYNVYDKKGNLDVTATNIKMRDGLLALSADNYVQSARIEQENWNDDARGRMHDQFTQGLGVEGDKAMSYALEEVDPRDQRTFMATAFASNKVYEDALYSDDEWHGNTEVKYRRMFPSVNTAVLKSVYEAGRKDKAESETPYLNARVKRDEKMSAIASGSAKAVIKGKFFNETPYDPETDTGRDLKANEQIVFEELAGNFNANITMIDAQDERLRRLDKDGRESYGNANVNLRTGEIYISNAADVGKIVHEFTHLGAVLAPEQFLEMSNYVIDKAYKANPEATKELIQSYKNTYKGSNLNDAQIREEVVADLVTDFIKDERFARDIAMEEPGFFQQLYNAICDILRALRNILATGRITDEAVRDSILDEIDAYEQTRRMWVRMMREAAKYNATIGMETLQEQIYEESRYSISDDIIGPEDITRELKENFDEYGEDEENLRIAAEAVADLQRIRVEERFSLSERGRNLDGSTGAVGRNTDRGSRTLSSSQYRTVAKGITSDLVNDGYIDFRGKRVNGPEDLAKLCQVLRDPRFETFRIFLVKGNKIVSCESVSSRLPGITAIHNEKTDADYYDMIKDRMQRTGADGYYLMHNHPSGDVTASMADLNVSAGAINELGSKGYKGHVILDHDKFGLIEDIPTTYSNGQVLPTAREVEMVGQKTFDLIHEPEIDHPMLGEKVGNGQDLARVGSFVNTSDDVSVLIYMTPALRVRGLQEISNKTLSNNSEIRGFIRNQGIELGSSHVALYTTSSNSDVEAAALSLYQDGALLDAITGTTIGSLNQMRVDQNGDPSMMGRSNDELKKRTIVYESAAGTSQYGDAEVRFSLDVEQERTIAADVGPDIRFSYPTFETESAKAKFIAGLNGGKGGFAGLSEIASGKTILRRVMKSKGFADNQTDAVVGFLEHMAKYLEDENLQMKYHFIGWKDISDGEVTVRRDADGNIVSVAVSAMVVNGEYPVNFDLTTICNKREGVMEVIQALTQKYDADTGKTVLNSIKLTDEKMWKINDALKKEGIDTACLGCFVEARRYYTNRFIDKIDDVWNSAVREARRKLGLPEEEYFNFAKGRKVSGEDYNQISDLWTAYDESAESKRSPAQRIKILMDEIVRNKDVDSPYLKLISAEDILTPEGIRGFKELSTHNKDRDMVKMIKSIYGTSAPKEILAFTPYNSEIALLPDKIKGVETSEYLKSIGGTRVQSFSDFKMEHFFDHMQMVADEAARGFVNHGYAKVIAYPRLFGLTGRKINMSVMFDVLPPAEWQKVLGCSPAASVEVAQKYQGLRFVKEKPKDNPDNRPYKEVTIEGVHGYLTYLVSDADYVNSVYNRLYQENLDAGMSPEEARRKANSDKPFEQSINYKDAVELENREGYKENVGIIAVAFGDEHLRMLLDDPNVRYIIPYHRSGLPVFIAQKTALDIARNYTDYQNTNKAKRGLWFSPDGQSERMKSKYAKFVEDNPKPDYPAITFFEQEINGKGYTVEFGKKNSKEKISLAGTGTFDVYENLDKVKDIREISNAYLEHCIENNQVPVFHEFAGHPNYYKMLFDFAVTDGTTDHIYPQRPVKNIYPGLNLEEIVNSGRSIEDLTPEDFAEFYKEIEKGLAEQNAKTELRRNRLGKVLDEDLLSQEGENSIIADSNIQHIVNGTPDHTSVRYANEDAIPEESASDIRESLSVIYDDAYMQAVNSGNMDEAQRLVDEAAKVAGFDTPLLHHGTPFFGFTTFDLARGENIIFATNSRLTAETYSGETSRNRISEKSKVDIDQLYGQGLLDKAKQHLSRYKDYRLMPGSEKEDLLDEARSEASAIAQDAAVFIAEHSDAFNEEKLEIANRIVDAINNISVARNDDDVQTAWDDFQDAMWNLKWMDESIQFELTKIIQDNYPLQFIKTRISDFMYAGDLYARGGSTSEYVYDNQLALELGEELNKGIYGLYGNPGKQLVIDANGSNWNQIIPPDELGLYGPQRTRSIAEAAKAKGYDSVLFKNLRDNGGATAYNGESDVYMFFNPNQVKSADPVTYAEDGSVIPLSERFDPTNNDLRYSLPTTDADGKVLTDGQMEFFKNSQARDEQGRLVRCYRRTRIPGSELYDKRMWFYSDRKEVAQSYVDSAEDETILEYEDYLNITNPLILDCNGAFYYELPFSEAVNAQGEAVNIGDTFEESAIWDAPNTNTFARIGRTRGYDGIILRNVIDNGVFNEGENQISTIYVAFDQDQMRGINNLNPAENPDIRWSFTEDEANSKMDYDYATSDSYEMLEMYEEMLSDQDCVTEFVNATDEQLNVDYFMKMLEKYGKADKKARKTGKAVHIKLDNTEEAMDAFYSSLVPETHMVYDDVLLEEGRMRMAASKQDFWNNLNTKWNDRWVSGGEVLEIKSVKKDVRNLVMGIMDKAVTDKKYDEDLVNKTLVDMRFAYQLMKQGRSELASALLYHSALRMIENTKFIEDDTAFREYRELRDYLRNTRISFSERYWSDVHFNEYRKRNMGRIKLVKGENNIDKGIYSELERQWPQWFGEQAMADNDLTTKDIPSMMEQLDYVLNLRVDPVTITYSSEDCASWAFDIANDLYDIMENGDRIVSTADRYKEKYEAKAQAMKVRQAEAILRIRKARDEGIAEEKARFREYKEEQREKKYHSKYFDSIAENHKILSERLLTNTKDKHIPEQYKKALARLLAAFDLQTTGSKKVEARRGAPGKKTIKMQALKTTLNNIEARSSLFHVNDSITDIIERLLGRDGNGEYKEYLSVEGKALDELTSTELKDINDLLKALVHEFNNYESVRVGIKRQQAADIGSEQIKACLEYVAAHGQKRDWNNFLGSMDKILNLDEVTPAYMFRMIDRTNTGIGMMYKELRRSFNRYVQNQNQLNKWMDDILGEYHNKGKLWNKYGADQIREWRLARSAKDFQLECGRKISLTPAQMMSIYCLSNREQAVSHMKGAGIVVQPVTYNATLETDIKRLGSNSALPAQLTDTDIRNIKSKLTPEQIKVATDLQQLMSTKMAEWGNEASMAVIGIRLFEDPDYFPIKSSKAALEKDFTADQFAQAIRSFGFTKAVQPGASNAIAVDDIFDVVAEHCNQMNLYNSYSESMNDFMKVYNYHEVQPTETGYSDYSVEDAIKTAFSEKATTYIGTFMKDLNGNVGRDRTTGIESMMNDLLARAKKASVFANGRVALQQPTAIMRAFAVIDPKYLKGVSVTNATMREMFKHSSIALWKSWGYYDINMGKSIEDLIMNEGKWSEDMMTDLYGKLDNRTWTAIWGMCKAEIEDKHKDVKVGSDEYWELVSERMDEVVDLTQVVDSPFHRSHAMRSKNTLVKMFTAFMAEPTLTFNMVRDGIIRAREETQLGNKGNAVKILGRTMSVFALSAATTAAAAAIWDVLRGKDPGDDDDEDKSKWDLWLANFFENFKDNINLLNNIYYVKDIMSIFQGWDQKNLGLQGFRHLADMKSQLCGERCYSKLSWWENFLAGIGYLSGKPFKTIESDVKAAWKLLGLETPGPVSAVVDYLDSMSLSDMNNGESSTAGAKAKSSGTKAKSDAKSDKPSTSASVKWWTYETAPFHVEDGSFADNILNRFGINLTSAEIAAIEKAEAEAEHQKQIDQIKDSLKDYTGAEYDKHLWDKGIMEGYGKAIEDGDFDKANEIEALFIECGGSQSFIDDKKLYHYSKNYVKTIVYDPTSAQIEQQTQMKNFLLSHGVTEQELSEKVYKSQTAKELKVAFRIGDEDAMMEELVPLIRAGLSEEDYNRLWANRNRLDIKKYKESGGKYADRLKSTGTYNWPITGTITSNFGHRSSPGGIGSTNHQGIDIAGSMGDPVNASDGGTVVFAGWYGGAGKTVKIQHDDGTITQYSHLSWWDVQPGDIVAQGQYIGKVGSTGNSTGPHLHFGVIKDGNYVDPSQYLQG